jgi:hypothetical protein
MGDVTDSQVVVGHGNVIGEGNIVAHEGGAAVGSRGVAATGQSAAAAEGAAAAAGKSSANVGFAERAKNSRVFKIAALIALLATAFATGLLVFGVTDLGVAGYIIAIISIIVGVIPLFSKR